MGVTKAINQGDSVLLENVSRLFGSFVCDEEKGDLRMGRRIHELPGRCWIRTLFDLEDHLALRLSEAESSHEIQPRLGLARGHDNPGNPAQDANRVCLEATFNIYQLILI